MNPAKQYKRIWKKNIDCSPARYRNGHYEDCFTDTL